MILLYQLSKLRNKKRNLILLSSIKKELCEYATNFKIKRNYRLFFIGVLIMYLIYIIPIIIANRYYNDDLARSLTGLTGWNGDGRPLTELLMKLLSGGTPITDISPLPLLLSMIILAYTITLYVQKNLINSAIGMSEMLFFSLVITNPFMLENLSYKFDVISMILALCLAFFPFIITIDENCIGNTLFVTIVVVAALSLYQVVICAFCALLLIDLFLTIFFSSKINFAKLLSIIAGVVAGAIIYKTCVANFFMGEDDWRYEASKIIAIQGKEGYYSLKSNCYTLLSLAYTYLKSVPILVIVFTCISILIAWGIAVYKIAINNKHNNRPVVNIVLKVLFAAILPFALVVVNIIPLALINGASSKCRILVSTCTIELFISLLFTIMKPKVKKAIIILCIPLLLFSYSYSFSYGNALKSQKEYETYLTYSIVHDIETINYDGAYTKICIVGDTPKSQQVQLLIDKYPQFENIVPTYIGNDWWIKGAQLWHYMQTNISYSDLDNSDQDVIKQTDPIIRNAIFSCYCNNDKIIIKFSDD